MAAPTFTERPLPEGLRMDDGFPTIIANSEKPEIAFWEKTVTPPGWDGGDMIETTTMHNVRWRTKAPRELITMTELKTTAAYDPKLYDAGEMDELINVPCSWTVHYPAGDAVVFWGCLRMAEPSEISEGEQPELDITIEATNTDPDTGAEEGPVYVPA